MIGKPPGHVGHVGRAVENRDGAHLRFLFNHALEVINHDLVAIFNDDLAESSAELRQPLIEHRRIAYDHEASAARVRGFGADWAEVIARRIERATIAV